MASTTNIMTALLILEAGEDMDALVTVAPEAAGVEGSSTKHSSTTVVTDLKTCPWNV